LEINYDASGPTLEEMMPYYRRVQQEGRSLVVRGSFTPDEARLLRDGLDARGLYLFILIKDLSEMAPLRAILGL